MLTITCDGLLYVLEKLVVSGLTLHLFTNEVTPDVSDGPDQYTEAVLDGYAAVDLDPEDWTIEYAVDGTATARHPTVTFTIGDEATVYGYYLTGGETLVAVQAFAEPYILPSGGATLSIAPRIQFSNP